MLEQMRFDAQAGLVYFQIAFEQFFDILVAEFAPVGGQTAVDQGARACTELASVAIWTPASL